MQEERKERQETSCWMQDEDVHILSFITALKFLVVVFFTNTNLYRPKMTGQEQLKRRNAAPSSYIRVIVVADFIL